MGTAPAGSVFTITRIRFDGRTVILDAEGGTACGRCPACGALSDTVHGRYRRRPLDLPWRGQQVQLLLEVRRFRCLVSNCERVTFAEDFGPALDRYARRTTAATQLLRELALAMGGEAGARLAQRAGLPTSPDTLLRLLRQGDEPAIATPRVLGVDDLALRRRYRYATLLIDLETHRPIDLLADRDAHTLAAWLRDHPGVEVIVRDRSQAYAEGARAGAPNAVQVADRFHLVQNASQALEELLKSRPRHVEAPATPSPPTSDVASGPAGDAPAAVSLPGLSPTKQREATRRAARIARWEEVRARHADGQSLHGIAREMGITRHTVRRLLARPQPLARASPPPRPTGLASPTLQPYVLYLQQRWQAGCTNVRQLCREITAQGYPGSYSLLEQALRPWRPPRRSRGRGRTLTVRWLCLRPPEQLSGEERDALEQVLAADAELASAYDLVQRFRALVKGREVDTLDRWLADAQASGLAPLMIFANGLVGDRTAVEAALTTPWSTGPVEGHVHRVKLIKRQGYGRAKLDLLRRRVVAA